MGQLAIACGGTGGHLFPGLAVAEAVRKRGHEVSFLISPKAVDRRALAGAGEERNGVEIPAVGWSGWLGAGQFAVHFLSAVRKAGDEMAKRKVGALLGMGGFVSGAASVAARCEAAMGGVKVTVSGTPVRSRLGGLGKEEALRKLGLHPQRHLIAVLGGSQGARGLNEAMLRGLGALKSESQRMQILHLAGEAHAEKVRQGYEGSGFHAVVMGFCDEMEAVYAAAEVVVARAGAGTLAELAACRVPAILVPFPAAAGDHQMANARAYAQEGAAEVIAEKYLDGTELGQRIARMLGDRVRCDRMKMWAQAQDRPNAAETIAEVISHEL